MILENKKETKSKIRKIIIKTYLKKKELITVLTFIKQNDLIISLLTLFPISGAFIVSISSIILIRFVKIS